MGATAACFRAEDPRAKQARKRYAVGDFEGARGGPDLPSMREYHLTEDERRAGNRAHHCTDVFCVAVFAAAAVAAALVQAHASEAGDIRKLYHGVDFRGRLCGVDEGVADKAYLYWCPYGGSAMARARLLGDLQDHVAGAAAKAVTVYASLGHLDTRHPMCVSHCPAATDAPSCYVGATRVVGEKEDAAGTYTETLKYTYEFVQAYDTVPVAERLCLPASAEFGRELRAGGDWSLGAPRALQAAGEVARSWHALAGAALLAVLVGYGYLALIRCCLAPLVHGTLALAALLPLCAGALCLCGAYGGQSGEHLAEYGAVVPSTGNLTWDASIGCALSALGLLVALFACCCRRSIELVVGTLEAACECLWDAPSLLLLPLLSVLSKAAVVATMGYNLCLLATCGEVVPYEVSEGVPAGLARTFAWSADQQRYLVFYAFMIAWALELLHALDQFVVAYAAQLWFFREYVSIAGIRKKRMTWFPMLRGFLVGVIFHFGTLAFGACLLALFRVAYVLLSLAMRHVEQASEDEHGNQNCCARAMLGCCGCCVACWDAVIRFMCSKAYIVTAIESEAFCPAAARAFGVVAEEVGAIGALDVATWVLSIGGVITISGLGSYLTWFLLRCVPALADAQSEYFVPDPEAVTGVAAVVCVLVATSFMALFGMISDTIVFCWALDRQSEDRGGDYVPPRLRELLGDDGSDRASGSRRSLLG